MQVIYRSFFLVIYCWYQVTCTSLTQFNFEVSKSCLKLFHENHDGYFLTVLVLQRNSFQTVWESILALAVYISLGSSWNISSSIENFCSACLALVTLLLLIVTSIRGKTSLSARTELYTENGIFTVCQLGSESLLYRQENH